MVHEHQHVGDKFKNENFKHLLDLIHTIIRLSVLDMELHRAKKCQEVGVIFKKGEIFKNLFSLISRVASPSLAKMENMKQGHKQKAIVFSGAKSRISEKSDRPHTKRIEDLISKESGTQLQEVKVEFEKEYEFWNKFVENKFGENKDWESIPDAIAFQEAGIELGDAKKFLKLLHQNRNEDNKKELCPTIFKMAEKFMRLPFLNKIAYWNSIPNGRELKEAGLELKKAKKFTDAKNMMKLIHNATKLKEGGVKFQKGKQHTTFSINFSNGVLEISPLTIEEETETFLRNLIAYEQYSPDIDSDYHYVTHYACFMDDLINSPKDVELLRHNEIIKNLLGDDGVASSMFNKLCRHVTALAYPHSTSYAQTCIDMNKHCAEDWNEWKATLRHNYFNSPWALLSVLAAILLLGLTIIQTVFSIIN